MSAHVGTFPLTADQAPEQHHMGDNYLTHGKGIKSWLFTLDHKRIGIMYMVGILIAFFLGGVFAMILRTMLWSPHNVAAGKNPAGAYDFYNHAFTFHGAIMVFLFIIPAIPAILGNFVLPLQLGAKDVAFPRLNLLSWWLYAVGGVFFVYVLMSGVLHVAFGWNLPGGYGLDTGWTFYTPYSTSKSAGNVTAATLGAFILGSSSFFTAVNFIVWFHMLRPKGWPWSGLPRSLWALYPPGIIQPWPTPGLAITLFLLAAGGPSASASLTRR